jgi:ABC transport system ATP-binding/permease protein
MAPPVLALRGARLRLGERPLFDGLDVQIGRGQRICLVGRNGSGKSSLLKVLAGLLEPDGGERFVQPRTTIAYLPQEPEPGTGPAIDYVLRALPVSEDGARGRARAERVLAALGLEPEREVGALSGGELRRASLARALVVEPDVQLLDEPTNHLDLPTIEWLEQELAGFRGAFVLISHDRAFLRRLSRHTWWLDRGTLRESPAGFAAFEDWSEQLIAEEEAELARLDKRLLAEQHWLHRGVTARRKRNQGRLRRLEQLRRQRRQWLGPTGRVKLEASAGAGSGSLVIEADDLHKSWDGRPVVAGFSTRVMRGDRIGIIGPNGCGKTTLLGLLTGEIAPDRGSVRLGTGLRLARFDQTRRSLDPGRTPWQTLCPDGGDQVLVQGRYRHVVGYLRDFLFTEAQAKTPIRALSGGERNRLLLARVLARPSNLLVLDEPTNDLDMDTLDLLQEVLSDYEGTLLLVSHDRDFLDRLVSSVIAGEGDGRFEEHVGGYAEWLARRPEPEPERPRQPAARSKPRTTSTRLQREVDKAAARIAALETEIHELERRLADPDLYARDPAAFERASARLGAARDELREAEERWLEAEMLREAEA